MHACGHDLHMTNLVGVARYLASHRDQWSGTIVFIGQPAEELGKGAEAMLDDGLFARFPRPISPSRSTTPPIRRPAKSAITPATRKPTSTASTSSSQAAAATARIPKRPSTQSSSPLRLVLDLQTIISRETKPTEPAVITVGSIHGGSKHNVIPDELQAPALRPQLLAASSRTSARRDPPQSRGRRRQLRRAGTRSPRLRRHPSLYNDPELTAKVATTLKRVFGDANVIDSEPTMGGEDFSRYGLAGVPICMFRLGAINPDRLDKYNADHRLAPSLHSPLFYPDAEESLCVGIPAMVSIATDLLPPNHNTKSAAAPAPAKE